MPIAVIIEERQTDISVFSAIPRESSITDITLLIDEK